MVSWFQHTMSRECEECGMPFEDSVYESSPICKSCLDLMSEDTEWEVDYNDIEDE